MDITEIVLKRHTCKDYDETKKIPAQQVEALLTVLRNSPSSVNSQPWHFIAVTTDEGKMKIAPAFTEANQPKIKHAGLTVIFCRRNVIDSAYTAHLLDQEEKDGRFTIPGACDAQEKGRGHFVALNSHSEVQQQRWMEKQVYISLGFFLLSAAAMGLDATPIEGVDMAGLDQILNLHGQGFSSVVAAVAGYRNSRDFNAALPKSRLAATEVITRM